ncbi:hypothetical protein SARC_07976 [Sphaeroforma arctica JP610]|uniref:Uncharacterized protein n=1 Tax=Sphaeroforma arctica JP610 TaxID=667725 RepID=A0A0L0FSC3_9EUKA|nr:hypothetical protein SARC_07976 [Sphaeroforma arctica JP610]KNC79640.1 hypothetical protein SARC_07976 [Sphaeroforma arctica JP610]|eukprot:XP_014153542.1 hypothetical protein SARC_07976 [Sphaeroforma arctica JP610]
MLQPVQRKATVCVVGLAVLPRDHINYVSLIDSHSWNIRDWGGDHGGHSSSRAGSFTPQTMEERKDTAGCRGVARGAFMRETFTADCQKPSWGGCVTQTEDEGGSARRNMGIMAKYCAFGIDGQHTVTPRARSETSFKNRRSKSSHRGSSHKFKARQLIAQTPPAPMMGVKIGHLLVTWEGKPVRIMRPVSRILSGLWCRGHHE